MRLTILLLASLGLTAAGLGSLPGADEPPRPEPPADTLDARFRAEVRPFLDRYCVACHGPDRTEADIDLTSYRTAGAVAADLANWALVVEQLEAGSMPPAKAKVRPDPHAREAVLAWIGEVRRAEARKHAGDPGPVPARRLSNAEYDYSIRDLTGVDLRPTREFPVDPANEAGFDNSAESLSMSPALLKKYLEAARRVADHLVFAPDGLAFAAHPMLADTDRDKYCVNRIIDFYKRQRTDYADFFLAAWRFRHREALGHPDRTLDRIAADAGLSPSYLATVWAVLNDGAEEIGPIAALRILWDDLPAPTDPAATPRADCERLRDFVATLRRQLTPEVPNLTAPGINNGSQSFVLWKNRQFVANRRAYRDTSGQIRLDALELPDAARQALTVPDEDEARAAFEATFPRFCSTFPDAFVVTERARVYLDPKNNKGNEGRLLSAGFHSMTGYFRDDAPLCELVLDDAGRADLDRLWREFEVVADLPMRQYSSYLWFERAESGFLRGEEFDFVRAEDRDSASEAKIARLAEVYLDKAIRREASETALKAIGDQFAIISAEIRRVDQVRRDARPRHVESLQLLAERAYRRPLTADERQGIADFYRTLRDDDGLEHEDAIRDTLVGILMSPNFCYRVDLPGAGRGVRPLNDHDLASRLSYFLWSSLPDEPLLTLAASGELHRPEILAAQARRMLRDDRARALAVEFGGNWLDIRRFEEHNSVDRHRFPAFNDNLRRAMFEEPIRFFVDVVRSDGRVSDFLDGRHTFVNAELARHYGMDVTTAGPDDWVRVDDADRHGRGGLLPMAVFLTRNSPGLRTSPVKRGYWVARRLLGENIPAPPANVPDLPDDEADLGELTLRQTLERHRADPSCAGCHARFDGLGLAFEGYGPIGERREKDLGGRPVETRAEFPRGGEGDGLDGLRTYLQARRGDEFVDNLCRKLFAYALGRTLIPSDDETIETMRAHLAADGGRFGSLVESIVISPQFRNKRVETAEAEAR